MGISNPPTTALYTSTSSVGTPQNSSSAPTLPSMKIWITCFLALGVVSTILAEPSPDPEPHRGGYGGYGHGRRHGGIVKQVVKVIKDVVGHHNSGYGHHSGYGGYNNHGYNSIGSNYGRRNYGYGGDGRRHKRSADPEPHRGGYGGHGYGSGYGNHKVVEKVIVKNHGYNKYGHKAYAPKIVKKTVVKVVKPHHGIYGHGGYGKGSYGHGGYGHGGLYPDFSGYNPYSLPTPYGYKGYRG